MASVAELYKESLISETELKQLTRLIKEADKYKDLSEFKAHLVELLDEKSVK